jgi:hypothetical protein
MLRTLDVINHPGRQVMSQRSSTIVGRGVRAVGIAAAANLVIYVVARAAGASLAVPDLGGPGPEVITLVPVLVMTALPLALGFALAVLLARSGRSVAWLGWVGVAVAVLSLGPFLQEGWDGATVLALAPMHLVVGAAYLWALRAGSREPADRVAA